MGLVENIGESPGVQGEPEKVNLSIGGTEFCFDGG